jgi:hypothetical protein
VYGQDFKSITAAACEAGWILNKTAEYEFILKTFRETSLKLEALPEQASERGGGEPKTVFVGPRKN